MKQNVAPKNGFEKNKVDKYCASATRQKLDILVLLSKFSPNLVFICRGIRQLADFLAPGKIPVLEVFGIAFLGLYFFFSRCHRGVFGFEYVTPEEILKSLRFDI